MITETTNGTTTIESSPPLLPTPVTEEVIARSLVGGQNIQVLETRPEVVTDTKMKKFCFRKPNQSIRVIYLENQNGQAFEITIDEATANAIARLFDDK